jgi:hypothetical protein
MQTMKNYSFVRNTRWTDMSFTDDEKKAFKQATKEALKEWLDEKYMEFGKWSMMGILAAALGALAYFLIWSSGWTKN